MLSSAKCFLLICKQLNSKYLRIKIIHVFNVPTTIFLNKKKINYCRYNLKYKSKSRQNV